METVWRYIKTAPSGAGCSWGSHVMSGATYLGDGVACYPLTRSRRRDPAAA
ncbi:MAG TPA: hypothetical protein VHJ79_10715 [Mycobacterium sp.]|nr:hypothetical protein [Mycobacterium sp.]